MGWDDHVPCTCTNPSRTHHLYSWVGGVGGVGWDDHVPCTCTHPSRTHHLYSWVGGVGGVGWDDHVPCTCTHPSRTHPLCSWVGWVGWGGMITYLALAHTLAEHITCIHGWVGWVGWDDHVPCTTKLLLQYYSGTTPYYKVLLRSSTTPVLQSNTSTKQCACREKVTPQQFLRSQATKNFGHKRPKIAVTSDPP